MHKGGTPDDLGGVFQSAGALMRRIRAGYYETPDGRFVVEHVGHKRIGWRVLDNKLGSHATFSTLGEAREFAASHYRAADLGREVGGRLK